MAFDCTINPDLILTKKGERPFQPDLGCDVQSLLFEPLDYGSSLDKGEIAETLERDTNLELLSMQYFAHQIL